MSPTPPAASLASLAAKGLGVLGKSLTQVGESLTRSVIAGGTAGARTTILHGSGSGGAVRASRDVRGSAVAYRCVEAIAEQGASVPLVARNADGDLIPHPFPAVWNGAENGWPNPAMSARTVATSMWWGLETRGTWFAYLDRTGADPETGPVARLWPLIGMHVEPVVDEQTRNRGNGFLGDLVGYRVTTSDGAQVVLLPGEVLWMRYASDQDPWGWTSPLRAASFALDLDAYAKEYQAHQFVNADRPSGTLFLGDTDPSTHDAVQAMIDARHSGAANAGRTMVLSGTSDATYNRFGLTAEEIGYLDTRVRNAEEVMLAYGVPRDYLMGGATYENREASRTTLWADTIVPKLDVVSSEFDRQVFPEPGATAGWDLSGVTALQDRARDVLDETAVLTQADLLTLNEARARQGLDPVPWGDVTLTEHRTAVGPLSALRGAPSVAPAPRSAPAVEDHVTVPGQVLSVRADDAPRAWTDEEAQAFYRRRSRDWRTGVRALAEDQQARVLSALEGLFGPSRSRKREAIARSLAQHVLRGGDPADPLFVTRAAALFDPAREAARTAEALASSARGTWLTAAEGTADRLGITFDADTSGAQVAMLQRLDALAGQVTATTEELLRTSVLVEGVQAGESVDALARRVRSVFTDLSRSRATTIARTEVVGGFNAASVLVAKNSGQVVGKQWLATKDDRTRPSHRALDGVQVQGMDAAFPNGVQHPGDPYGSAAETVNCRCTTQWLFADPALNPDPRQADEDWLHGTPTDGDPWAAWEEHDDD